jgi:DNA-binding transcriptional LysR family regulator
LATIHQFRVFLAAFELGSLTAAASRLGYAQPTVSEQVRVLERSLGARLFERVGRGLVPTEAAHALRPHAERALVAAEAAAGAVRSVNQLESGTIRFGVFGASRLYLGSSVVLELLRRHPGVRVELVGRHSTDVIDQLRRGRMEAAATALPVDDPTLEVHPVFNDELVYVSAHPDRVESPVTAARLGQAPLALAWASWANDPTRAALATLVESAGHTLRTRVEVEDLETTVDLAAEGEVDTVVSLGVLHQLGDRVPRHLGWAPIRPRQYDRFAIVHRRDAALSPATRLMIELVTARLLTIRDSAAALGRTRAAGRQ